jgi:hypothetical protein
MPYKLWGPLCQQRWFGIAGAGAALEVFELVYSPQGADDEQPFADWSQKDDGNIYVGRGRSNDDANAREQPIPGGRDLVGPGGEFLFRELWRCGGYKCRGDNPSG